VLRIISNGSPRRHPAMRKGAKRTRSLPTADDSTLSAECAVMRASHSNSRSCNPTQSDWIEEAESARSSRLWCKLPFGHTIAHRESVPADLSSRTIPPRAMSSRSSRRSASSHSKQRSGASRNRRRSPKGPPKACSTDLPGGQPSRGLLFSSTSQRDRARASGRSTIVESGAGTE